MTHTSGWDEPSGIAPRGTLALLPGRGEQPGLYQRFGRRIAVDGYRVRVLPDPARDPEGVAAELKHVLTGPQSVAPRVLAGVDTGALAALRAAAAGSVPVDALILVGLPDPDPARAAEAQPASWQDEVEARASCPTHRGLIADQTLLERGALTADRIPQPLREPVDLLALAIPVLALHGDDDLLSPFERIRADYARLPRAEVVLVRQGRHDVLNAASHRSVAARVVQFLETLRTGPDGPPILQEVKP